MEYAHRPVRFRSGTNTDCDPHRDAGWNPDTHTDSLSALHSNPDANCFGNTDSDTCVNTYANGNAGRYGDANSDPRMHAVQLCGDGSGSDS